MAKWNKLDNTGTVDDRRSMAPVAAGGIGVFGLLLIVGFNLISGGDLGDVINQVDQLNNVQPQVQQRSETGEFAGEDSYEVFASSVLGSANQMWSEIFETSNQNYREPELVLFRQATNSECGTATSQVGPHYCPIDENIYLDETFFDLLENKLGASGGDVAQAYVIAHEVGHHVQQLTGSLEYDRSSQADAIAIELQADCYAGLWANYVNEQDVLEEGEISEALDAARAVGDDNIQSKTSGQVNKETWTHGSSQQRLESFLEGFNSGDVSRCSIS